MAIPRSVACLPCESPRGLLYGSGDPTRPRLLALAAGEASFGLRSFERSLGFLSRDLLLDRRRDVTEGSLLARSGSLLAILSCTTRGGVGTSPLASCWVKSFLWLKGDRSLAMMRPLLGGRLKYGAAWRDLAFQVVKTVKK